MSHLASSTCCEGQKATKTARQGDGGADAALYNGVLDHLVIQSQIEVSCSCECPFIPYYESQSGGKVPLMCVMSAPNFV